MTGDESKKGDQNILVTCVRGHVIFIGEESLVIDRSNIRVINFALLIDRNFDFFLEKIKLTLSLSSSSSSSSPGVAGPSSISS